MTEEEKKRLADIEWRKRKNNEEEQTRLNNVNADQQRLLIFSHIFRIAPRLKPLSKRIRKKLKPRVIPFHQKIADESKAAHMDSTEAVKDKRQKSNTHLSLFHNAKLHYKQQRVSDELLRNYVSNLKKRI